MKRYFILVACLLILAPLYNTSLSGEATDNIIVNPPPGITSSATTSITGAFLNPPTPFLSPDKVKNDFAATIPVLMYHHVQNPLSATDRIGYNLSISPENFEKHLQYLKKNHIEVLTFWDLKEIIEGEMALPPKSVMLTFDDGYLNNYTNAYPLLEKYGYKGVFFIISEKPDLVSDYINWQQLREMSASGHEIASHTISHPDLTSLTDEELTREILDSKQEIEEKVGTPVISLCYPGGDYNLRVIENIIPFYTFARTTEAGTDFAVNKRLEIPTVRVFPSTSEVKLDSLFDK